MFQKAGGLVTPRISLSTPRVSNAMSPRVSVTSPSNRKSVETMEPVSSNHVTIPVNFLSSSRIEMKGAMWARKKMLESYVPDILLQQLETTSMFTGGVDAFSRETQAAVVLADISGFTPLTERLCKERDGAERLSEILNSYFTIMIDIIYKVCCSKIDPPDDYRLLTC
jgi:hypothetical protein